MQTTNQQQISKDKNILNNITNNNHSNYNSSVIRNKQTNIGNARRKLIFSNENDNLDAPSETLDDLWAFLNNENKKHLNRMKERWNFDFEKGEPLNDNSSRYEWQLVQSKSNTFSSIPSSSKLNTSMNTSSLSSSSLVATTQSKNTINTNSTSSMNL
ncbi:hypothetical protein ABK040_007817 [Willaertia magna]